MKKFHFDLKLNLVFLLIIAIFSLTFIYYASTKTNSVSTKNNNSFSITLQSDPSSFNPALVYNLKDVSLMKHLFEGLYRISIQDKPVNALVKNTIISEDERTFTLHLKPSYWNDGTPLTAHDFERSFKEVLEPNFPSKSSQQMFIIKNAREAKLGNKSVDEVGVKAIDDLTLEIELEQHSPLFKKMLTHPVFFPRKQNCPYNHNNIISNGPFNLCDYKQEHHLILSKNPLYHKKTDVHFDKLNFIMSCNASLELLLLNKKTTNFIGRPLSHNIPTEAFPSLQKNNHLIQKQINGTCIIKVNLANKYLQNKNLRKALSFAINRSEIIEHLLQGSHKEAFSIAPMLFNTTHDRRTFQSYESQTLLAQSHFKQFLIEENITNVESINLMLNFIASSTRSSELAQAIQQCWKTLFCINVSLVGLEQTQLYNAQEKKIFDLLITEILFDYCNPAFLYYYFLSEFSYLKNYCTYCEKCCSILKNCNNIYHHQNLTKSLLKINSHFVDEQFIIPLYHLIFKCISNKPLQSLIFSSNGTIDFSFSSTCP